MDCSDNKKIIFIRPYSTSITRSKYATIVFFRSSGDHISAITTKRVCQLIIGLKLHHCDGYFYIIPGSNELMILLQNLIDYFFSG